MSQFIPVFTSPTGEAACMAAYQTVLDRWPVPYTQCVVPTTYGDTHVIVSGADDKPPLVLMHALFASAAVWYPNVGQLSEHFKVYAVDVIGEANRSRPTRPIKSHDEMADWFRELLDGTGIHQTYLAGNSYGAFMSASYAMRMPERIRRLVLIGPAATFHPIIPFFLHMFIPKAVCLLLPKLPGRQRIIHHSLRWMYAGLPKEDAWDRLFYQLMLHGSMTTQILPKVYKKEELSRIQATTLLLLGDREKIYRPGAAIRAARQLMPDLKVKTIPNAHHITALAQPEIVNQAMIRFFLED